VEGVSDELRHSASDGPRPQRPRRRLVADPSPLAKGVLPSPPGAALVWGKSGAKARPQLARTEDRLRLSPRARIGPTCQDSQIRRSPVYGPPDPSFSAIRPSRGANENERGRSARRPALTSRRRSGRVRLPQAALNKVLALPLELCLPKLVSSPAPGGLDRRTSGFQPESWPQGQSEESTPLTRLPRFAQRSAKPLGPTPSEGA
jgi:hypothetical protein